MRPQPVRPASSLPIALAVALLAAACWPAAAVAQRPGVPEGHAEYVRSHYTKFEHRVPMRDGARLFTAVYLPNDTSRSYPILLFRTPYSVGPYGADKYRELLGPDPEFDKEGFIFVLQDVRGRFLSEGEFVNMRPHIAEKAGPADVDESTDTYDTIEWLLDNIPGHNGRVGQWGVSYPGFYTAAGAIDSHPALAAVSPQAPIADWFWDDMHHHGAFILPLAFNFFSSFGVARPEPTTEFPERFDHGTPDGYQFFLDLGPLANVNERYFAGEIDFWNQIIAHPNYDEFWQARNLLPHLENISAAVMTVGGWFDTEDLYGPLNTYRAIEEQNPGISNSLVMGPWPHGGWRLSGGDSLGSADFGFKTAEFFRELELGFFKHHLKQEGELDLPEALVFETGANRWRRFDAWPPRGLEERKLFLQPDGGLAFSPPAAEEAGVDEYPSDPAKPVPYTMEITTRWARDYMTEDQRFAARRPDVLVYASEPLEEDLTLAGPLTAELWVSTTGSASDFVVKLVDVFPPSTLTAAERRERRARRRRREPEEGPEDRGHHQMLVRAEILRGRFRNSYETPEPFVPDEIARLEFELQDVLHTFQRGHRVMIQIQSSWFPFVDRNPQTYVPNIFEATAKDFIKVTNRVHRSPEHPSGVRVGVLPQ
jgi:putative CocE/NonD family hydrolase